MKVLYNKWKSIIIIIILLSNFLNLVPSIKADGSTMIIGLTTTNTDVTFGEDFNITCYLNPGDEQVTAWKVYPLTYNNPTQLANCSSGSITYPLIWNPSEFSGINNTAGKVETIQGVSTSGGITSNSSLFEAEFIATNLGSFIIELNYTQIQNAAAQWLTGYDIINLSITVYPSAPSNLQISSQSQNQSAYNDLSWTIPQNSGIDKVILNYNTDHIPNSETDGTEIYNGTGTLYNHTNVPFESNIYYAAWGWNETENMCSIISSNVTSETNSPLPATFNAEAVDDDNHSINLTWTLATDINTQILRPNNAGSSTTWTPTPSFYPNYATVYESSTDDLNYIQCTGASTYWDSFAIDNPTSSGIISQISVTARLSGAVFNVDYPDVFITLYNTTKKQGTAITTSGTITDYSQTWSQNPWTLSSWTWQDIENLEIGVESTTTATSSAKCTQLYLTVSYQSSQIIYIEHNNISTTWIKGSGTEIYNDTDTSFQDTGLSSKTRYYYQAWVYDATDNVYSTTYLSANAVTNGPNSPPDITAVSTPLTANTSDTITVNVSVTDLDGIGSVWLNGGYGSLNNYSFNESMSNTGGDYYEVNITIPNNSTDYLSYNISANDTLNVWSTSSTYTCTVTDIQPPVPTDNTPSTTIVAGGIAFFLVNCTDNVGTSSIKIAYIQGSASGNVTLSLVEGTAQNGSWNGSYIVPLTNANNISYTVNATDTSGNSNTSLTGSITISDDTKPSIGSVSIIPSSGDMGSYINISCEITDNIEVHTVSFNITKPDSTITNTTITNKNGDIYYDNSTYDLRGTYTVVIYANDTSDNLNASTSKTFNITNRQPVISNPNPSNQSTTADPHGFVWNVTITDEDSDQMNWTIVCSNGESNTGDNDTGGNKTLTLTDTNLAFNTNYTVCVNASDGYNWTNNTFWFKTRQAIDPALPTIFTATAINRTVINITWIPSGNASHTYIEYLNESEYTSNWAKGSGNGQWNCTNTSYNHTGLTPNMKYYYQAWSYNATDNTWSSQNVSANATTSNHVPIFSDPTPANGSTDQALTVNWSINIADSDADTFSWWINCSAGSSSGTGASDGRYNVTLSGLGFNTTYRVNVTAVDSYSGRNTSSYNFTTRLPYYPSIPTDFTAVTYNRTVINLSWTWPSQYADKVCINYTSGSTAPSGTSGFVYNDTSTTYNITGLEENTLYSFSIWGYNATDNVYSQTYNISSNTTQANIAPVISGITPANAASNIDKSQNIVNVTVTDANNEDTITWNITVYNSSSTLIASNNSTGAINGSSINCSLTTPLDYDETYTWNVNITDGFTWTNETYTFTIRSEYDPKVPTSFLASSYNRTVINITWTPGGNASHTYIEYLNLTEYTSNWAKGSGNGQWNCTNTSFNHTGLTPNTKYYYQAWSYNATDNTWSSQNVSANATTNNQVPVLSDPIPANGSTGQGLTVNWSINITDNDADTFSWWINCSAGSSSGTGASDGRYNVTLSGLGFNTTYRVNVTAVDSYSGMNTSSYNFTTRLPYYPSIPTDFTAVTYNRTVINLSWTWSSQYADKVCINYTSGSTAPSGTSSFVYNDTSTTYNITGLEENTLYSFSIWGYNATDNVYSHTYNTSSNTTQANTAPQISGITPANAASNVDKSQNIVNVTVTDANNEDTITWNITVYNSSSTLIASNNSTGAINGSSINCSLTTPLDYDETYTWNVNVTDGFTWTNATYTFTIRSEYDPKVPSSLTATSYNRTVINISWTPGGNASHTYIEYLNESEYTSNWAKGSGHGQWNCTNTSFNHTGLTPNMKYYYQAWSYNATDNTWSSQNVSANATTSNHVPIFSDPIPANGSTGQGLTVNWSINITDNDADTFSWWINCSAGSSSGTGASDGRYNVTLSGLGFNTTYRVNVTAVDSYSGRNTSTYNFTTRTPYYPSIPTDFTAVTYNRTVINLSWTWPSQYADKVCINYTFGSTAPSGTSSFDYNGTTTTYNITGLEENTLYSFSIWGYNATDNVYSHTYNTSSNTTQANTAPVISGINPSNNSTNIDITQSKVNVTISDYHNDTMTWNISVYNASFALVASDNGTSGNGSISCSLSPPLDYDEVFTWNVNVSDGYNWTNATNTFTIRSMYTPDMPGIVSSVYNTTQINLTIGIGANTSHVLVEYNTISTWSLGEGNLVQNNTNTSANITGLNPHTKYYFQAWAYNTTDNVWSNANSTNATTDNTPVSISTPNPVNGTTTANPHGFTWSVNITDADGDTFNWTIGCSNGENTNGTDETNGRKNLTLTDTNLTYDTLYTVWVNATDGYNSTNESFSFTTRSQYIPSPPTDLTATPYNLTTINLSWVNIGTNLTYIERNSTDNAVWSRLNGTMLQNLTTNITYNDTGLSYGTHYYYRAWSYNETDDCYSLVSSVAGAYTAFANDIIIKDPDPADVATNILTNKTNVSVTINSTDGSSFNYTISGNFIEDANGNQTDSSFVANITSLTYGTEYTWMVRVQNTNGWANASFSFTTNYKPLLTVSANPESGRRPLTTIISYTLSDPDGSISNASLNFGDGTTINVTQNASGTINHTYSSTGTYTVTLTAVDDQNATNTATTIVQVTSPSSGGGGGTVVTNYQPTANANGPYHALVDKPVFFDGSKSTDSDGTIVSYSWMFGDGSTSNEMSPAHTYTTQGVYMVILTVTDNKGATGIDTTTATITSDKIEVSNITKQYIEELYNISLPEQFYAIDSNGDGSIDGFNDINDILESIRFVVIEEHDTILIAVNGDLDQLFIWDTSNDSIITPVKHSIGTILSEDTDTSSNSITVTVEVDKANWTYFQIADIYPEYSTFIIQTDDGRIISDEYIWRENNTIFVLDDPSIIYEIIYTRFLFDISLTLTKDTMEVDEQLEALIELINVGTPGLVNATLSYYLLKDDTIIWSEHQDLTVSAHLAFTKMISTKGLAPGSYTLQVVHTYGIDQTAMAQASFTIQEPTGGVPWVILIIAIIIALGAVFYYLYKKGYIVIER